MLQEAIHILLEAVREPFYYFIEPKKRIHILYLFTSLILALYVYLKTNPKIGFLRYIFPKKVWLSNSAKVDYSLFIFNGLFKTIVLAPMVILGIYLQEFVSSTLFNQFGPVLLSWNRGTIVAVYTITIWLVGDFASFLTHYLMHKIPFLWRFHKIHHSATVMNPITQYRIHPGELLVNNAKTILVFGLVTGIFYYLADGTIGIIAFIGVNVFKFIFLALGANLRHSHVKLTFPTWLEYILISPYQHQIHHSDNSEHFDRNIGSHLAIWDWLFGTLIVSKRARKVRFGLGEENNRFKTFTKALKAPLEK